MPEDAADAALLAHLNAAFFDSVLTRALTDPLAEYSVPGKAIGHGRRTC